MESFIDDYQAVRLVVGSLSLAYLAVMLVGEWWMWGSPIVNLAAALTMTAHAAWSRYRGVRNPRQMLLIDTTLVGASLFGLPGPVMAAFVGLLAVATTLFLERWRRGRLAAPRNETLPEIGLYKLRRAVGRS